MEKMMERDEVLFRDMEEIANQKVFYETLKNSSVFVTGATGLLGSQIVMSLLCMNRLRGSKIRITAMARSEEKARKVFGDLYDAEGLAFYYGDINHPIVCENEADYIIHGASSTSSKYFVTQPVETIFTALDGTRNVLEFARMKKSKAVVYLSSLEVYGTPEADSAKISEKDYGYLDPLSVRSSYSEGKRMAECMCAAYASEYGVPVKIARLSQTFGAGVEYQDNRVFAEFARCAAEKRDIVLHTPGNTIRSYCYTKDAVSAIFFILVNGNPAEAYNVTNMDTAVSIKEMAELVCGLWPESGIRVRIEIPEDASAFGYNPEMVIRLDSSKLQKLGWQPTVGLEEMFVRMMESSFLKERR